MDNGLTLLGLVGAGSEYGYDLKQRYDRYFGAGHALAFGQVYATLARLIRDGLIERIGDEAGAGPDRKRYAITSAGRERITAWMFTPDAPADALRSNLFAKTTIALLLGDDTRRLLDVQRAAHLAEMRRITRAKTGADGPTLLLCDHALFHLEADLRWIDLAEARVDDLRDEVRA